jgi:hypothetical protein
MISPNVVHKTHRIPLPFFESFSRADHTGSCLSDSQSAVIACTQLPMLSFRDEKSCFWWQSQCTPGSTFPVNIADELPDSVTSHRILHAYEVRYLEVHPWVHTILQRCVPTPPNTCAQIHTASFHRCNLSPPDPDLHARTRSTWGCSISISVFCVSRAAAGVAFLRSFPARNICSCTIFTCSIQQPHDYRCDAHDSATL